MASAGIAGCSQSGDGTQAQQSDRLTKMLDDRRYDDVIRLIQSDATAQAEFPDLLAMAYLGKSGFEPLKFASQVLAAQSADASLDHLVPGCDASAIQSQFSQLPIRCVLRRLWAHLPDPEDANFVQARTLFRAAYPTPSATAVKYNALIAVVESASAISRLGKLAVQYQALDPSQAGQADTDRMSRQIQLAADEAQRALDRMTYGGSTLSSLLTGLDHEPLVQNSGVTVEWIEQTGLPLVIQFADDPANGAESETVKAALLQMLDQLVKGLSQSGQSAP